MVHSAATKAKIKASLEKYYNCKADTGFEGKCYKLCACSVRAGKKVLPAVVGVPKGDAKKKLVIKKADLAKVIKKGMTKEERRAYDKARYAKKKAEGKLWHKKKK